MKRILYQESVQVTCIKIHEFSQVEHTAFRPRPRSRTCDTLEVFFNPQMDPLCIVILGLGTNRNC